MPLFGIAGTMPVVHCKRSKFDVYIGRPSSRVINLHSAGGHGVYIGDSCNPSKWGNPFKIGEHGDRNAVVARYAAWVVQQSYLMESLHELVGKVLGCWCAPQLCHGHILVALSDVYRMRYMSQSPIISFSGEHAFLSNFYPRPLDFEGVHYPTSEHAYQASKTDDMHRKREIADLLTPGQAKRAGHKLHISKAWFDKRVDVMEAIIRVKFQHPALADMLVATGNRELIEGNHWGDKFWGVPMSNGVISDMRAGENQLGKILMRVRAEIKRERWLNG